ncbi:MAG: GWxTD domain-containing protein [Ignavibacteriaceae bacterium]|nr:GWxTD domain-containing protein [Ignavibacteriaceae bacterium]
MNKYTLSFVFFLFCLTAVHPQNMNFEFDYAQFGYDSLSNYVEFYYSFDQSCLQFIDTDTTDYVEGILHIEVSDSTSGEDIIDRQWMISNVIRDTLGMNRSLIGVVGFIIDKGSYKVVVTGSDANNLSNKRVINEYFTVRPFLNLNTAISDLQLASNIIPQSDNTSSIFYKNTFEVTPMPASICGENQPVLFYYSELYNLQSNPSQDDLRLDELVINSRGQVVSSKAKKINKLVDSRVEVGMVKVHKLPTDTYRLLIDLIDSTANYGVSSSKRFFVYNPSIMPADSFQTTVSPVLSTTFGAMSEEEIDDLFAKSKYIATEPELNQYKSLSTLEAKREFIYQFWKTRDENTSNPKRSYQNYMRRIDESNDRFSAMGKEGWKTDRGRVFLVYGEPSEIDRHPNETDTRPYVIWIYESIEGGVLFVFGDLTGFSDYQLLHSTKRGELRDDSWRRRIAVH